MSLDWPVDPFARFDFSRSSLSHGVPSDEQQRGDLPASTRSRWRQGALHSTISDITTYYKDGMDVAPSFPKACDVLPGTPGVWWDQFFSRQRNREFKLKYLEKLFDANNILCLQEVHGKDEHLQAIQVLAPRFRFFGTFIPDNENAEGSAIGNHRDLLPEEALVTHLVTCHCRDHLVSIQTGRHNLVIVNVHFEPELTLRQLCGRLRLIHSHWDAYRNGVGIILGGFNICDPEEDALMSGTRHSLMATPGKTAVFHSFFPHVLEVAQPDYTRRDSTVLGIIRTLSRIDHIFINLPMAEARDFHCSSHVIENFGNRAIPSDHAAVRLVIQKPTNRGHQSKRVPSWMSKHPVFCSLLQQNPDDHNFSRDP